MGIDYSEIGLKVGLEIHQQLDTKTKLFCNCSPVLSKKEPEITFLRRLRPTQSELGQTDSAAFFEFQKGIKIQYEADRSTSCLVEMDEEPPHPLNMEAVEVVLTAALMMNMQPIDEIHVMRKTVIDGSNTSGFQRTCIIASDGWIKVGEKTIPIQAASLEEDAARKTGTQENGKTICYRIDRLGIPLIEVTTAPVIHSPKEAQKVALVIGQILRDTGRAIRGLGTIRQDLNVSLPNGALIEIKGVQQLDLISKVVEYEVQRQLGLIQVKDELQSRGIKKTDLKEDFIDISKVFRETKCKVVRKAIDNGYAVLAVKLPKFQGILKHELMPNFRVGSELSDRAKFWGRVGGIFHTDEMPAYGITVKEIEAVRKITGAKKEHAVVFEADIEENVRDSLKAVINRAKEAIIGVPAETRTVKEDGTTRYMRPRPGAARMYPETDIPPLVITYDIVEKICSKLPEPLEKKLRRLMDEYNLNKKLAMQIADSKFGGLFEAIVKQNELTATTVAVFLTETLKSLKRDGIAIEKVTSTQIKDIFRGVALEKLAKEAIPDVFIWFSQNEGKNLADAIESLQLKMLSKVELTKLVNQVIAENKPSVDKIGRKAYGMLMNALMKEVRGKADPRIVSALLRERLK